MHGMQETIRFDDFTPLCEEDHFIDIERCSVEGCGNRVGRHYYCFEHAEQFDQKARMERMALKEQGFLNQPQQPYRQPYQQWQHQQQQQEGTWRDRRITRMREERSNKEFARQLEKKPKKISYKEQTSNRSLSEFVD